MFNDYFTKLAENLIPDSPEHKHTMDVLSEYTKSKLHNTDMFKIEEIDENTVLLMLEKLDTTKAAGIDSLGPRLLKLAAPIIYKPLSILPTLSKIFERHVASQIHEFLLSRHLFYKEQSGFRKIHSCQTKLTDSWLKEMDNGNS